MQKAGFEFATLDSTDPQRSSTPTEDFLNGVGAGAQPATVMAERREDGYGIYRQMTKPSTSNDALNRQQLAARATAYFSTLSTSEQKRWDQTMYGDRSGEKTVSGPDGMTMTYNTLGCVGDARKHIWGTPTDGVELPFKIEGIRSQISRAIRSDDQVRDATTKWSTCFKSKTGKSFKRPGQVRQSISNRYGDAQAGGYAAILPEERRLAVADAECVFESKLPAIYTERFRSLANDESTSIRAAVAKYLELASRVQSNSMQVINSQ